MSLLCVLYILMYTSMRVGGGGGQALSSQLQQLNPRDIALDELYTCQSDLLQRDKKAPSCI